MFSIQQNDDMLQDDDPRRFYDPDYYIFGNFKDNLEIITGTGEILEDIKDSNNKPKKWAEYKDNSLKIAELIKNYNRNNRKDKLLTPLQLKRFLHCADTLIFSNLADGSKRLKQAYFCKLRICPMCQWRRSLKMYSQVNEITNTMIKEDKNIRFLFLTLTIENCFDYELNDTINNMNKAFLFLTNSKKKIAIPKLTSFKNDYLRGYYKALEITYNRVDKTYHPHFHIVLAVDESYFAKNYISNNKWREYWKKALKLDYLPLVNIKSIKKNEDCLQYNVIAEIAKYPFKTTPILSLPSDEAISVLKTFTNALYRRRFISMGGNFKQIKQRLNLKDIETDNDLIHINKEMEKLNIVSYTMYKYRVKQGQYVC